MRIISLAPGECEASMFDTRAIRNPFQSVHAAALINFGEAIGGLAMTAWMESRGSSVRGIPTRLEGVFKKKARGMLKARVECNPDSVVASLKLSGGAKTSMDVVAHILDKSGDVVADVTATWSLQIVETLAKKKPIRLEKQLR